MWKLYRILRGPPIFGKLATAQDRARPATHARAAWGLRLRRGEAEAVEGGGSRGAAWEGAGA